MKPSISISQITQLEAKVAELTEALEEERAYSRMLEITMEDKIAARSQEIADVDVQKRIDDIGLGSVVKSLEAYTAQGMKVVQVAT